MMLARLWLLHLTVNLAQPVTKIHILGRPVEKNVLNTHMHWILEFIDEVNEL